MSRLKERLRAATAMALVTALSTAGCTQTVDGRAGRGRPAALDPGRSFGYVDDHCGLLLDDSIRELLGAESIERPYSGAVCQYVLSRAGGLIDVVFVWFDTGRLERERSLAQQRGSRITDKEVARHRAFLARRLDNAAACSATAAAGPGITSWWVQFRPQHGENPCPAAEQLLSATLSADL